MSGPLSVLSCDSVDPSPESLSVTYGPQRCYAYSETGHTEPKQHGDDFHRPSSLFWVEIHGTSTPMSWSSTGLTVVCAV